MLEFISAVCDDFFLAIIIYCICYILVLLAIIGDLWSGLRKAKAAGIRRVSIGFRQTVIKIAKYYNCLFSVSVVDCFLLVLLFALQTKGMMVTFPVIPFITVIVGGYLAFIEVRSVFEKLHDKEKARLSSDIKALSDIMKDEKKVNKLLKLLNYLEKNGTKEIH